MSHTEIQPGEMMVREGLLLPDSARIESVGYSEAWRSLVGTDSFALERGLSAAGSHLFFVAGELKVIELGRGKSVVRRGMKRILARGRKRNLNCMEITEITRAHLLGIPYVVIRGHSFHIQSGMRLGSNAERKSQQTDRDWAGQ
jgi:hypothetical protein